MSITRETAPDALVEPPAGPAPPAFGRVLREHGLALRRSPARVLQVNVGKLCNQACQHCHVDAGPRRTEIMTRETVEEVLAALRRCRIGTVDITAGGRPDRRGRPLLWLHRRRRQ